MSAGWIGACQAAFVSASTVKWKPGTQVIKQILDVVSHFCDVPFLLHRTAYYIHLSRRLAHNNGGYCLILLIIPPVPLEAIVVAPSGFLDVAKII